MTAIQTDASPKSVNGEFHVKVDPSVYVSFWLNGQSEGRVNEAGNKDVKGKMYGTMDFVLDGQKMRAKVEMVVYQGSFYMRVTSIDGKIVEGGRQILPPENNLVIGKWYSFASPDNPKDVQQMISKYTSQFAQFFTMTRTKFATGNAYDLELNKDMVSAFIQSLQQQSPQDLSSEKMDVSVDPLAMVQLFVKNISLHVKVDTNFDDKIEFLKTDYHAVIDPASVTFSLKIQPLGHGVQVEVPKDAVALPDTSALLNGVDNIAPTALQSNAHQHCGCDQPAVKNSPRRHSIPNAFLPIGEYGDFSTDTNTDSLLPGNSVNMYWLRNAIGEPVPILSYNDTSALVSVPDLSATLRIPLGWQAVQTLKHNVFQILPPDGKSVVDMAFNDSVGSETSDFLSANNYLAFEQKYDGLNAGAKREAVTLSSDSFAVKASGVSKTGEEMSYMSIVQQNPKNSRYPLSITLQTPTSEFSYYLPYLGLLNRDLSVRWDEDTFQSMSLPTYKGIEADAAPYESLLDQLMHAIAMKDTGAIERISDRKIIDSQYGISIDRLYTKYILVPFFKDLSTNSSEMSIFPYIDIDGKKGFIFFRSFQTTNNETKYYSVVIFPDGNDYKLGYVTIDDVPPSR